MKVGEHVVRFEKMGERRERSEHGGS